MAHFWGKKNFPGKSGSVTHNSIWVSSIMPKFRKDGQTLFYSTLPATAGGPKKVLLNFNPLQPGCCLFIPPENFKPHVLRGYKWAVPSCKELKHLLNNISTRMNNIQMQTRLNIFLRWIFSPNLNLKPMVMAIIFTRLSKSPLLTHFKPMLLFCTPWSIRYKDSVFQLSQNLLELHLKCIQT